MTRSQHPYRKAAGGSSSSSSPWLGAGPATTGPTGGSVLVRQGESANVPLFAASDILRAPPLEPVSLRSMYPTSSRLMKMPWPDLSTLCSESPPGLNIFRHNHDLRGIISYDSTIYKRRRSTWPFEEVFIERDDSPVQFEDVRVASIPVRECEQVSAAERMHLLPDEHIYRWDPNAATSRHLVHAASSATRGSLQISIATWNAGKFRGARVQELYRAGAFHIVVGQEMAGRNEQGFSHHTSIALP